MLLAIRRCRSDRRTSACDWKSSLSVSRLIMLPSLGRDPWIRGEGIVLTDPQNISGNRRPIGRHFAATDCHTRSYSGGMDILGFVSLRLARVCCVMLMLIGMRAVAVAADATSGIEAGVEQQVRELALAGTQHAGAGVTRGDIQG